MYVSKRVRDNNVIVDNVSLNYYLDHHPMCLLLGETSQRVAFMNTPGIQSKYESIDFYTNTIGLRNRIFAHGNQLKEYVAIRATADSLLSDFLERHLAP